MDIKANIDFNQLLESLKELEYGEVLIFLSVISIIVLVGIFILAKYGIISKSSTPSISTDKEINKEIKQKAEILNDTDLTEYKDAFNHHLKVYKLGRYLNTKNKDIDVLNYALYSTDSAKVIKLYEKAKNYLEKDKITNEFKFKKNMTLEKVKVRERIAICLYAFINFIGTLPFLGQIYISLFKVNSISWFSKVDQFFIFILLFGLSLIVVTLLLGPRAAQTFLEAKKIPTKVD
ncbi:hypothetical protein [Acinetobacter soli]|uniref:hypothetical protein n=1 Tax=Acinetobacter soli TaxID=487316 RepID=UPI00300C7445